MRRNNQGSVPPLVNPRVRSSCSATREATVTRSPRPTPQSSPLSLQLGRIYMHQRQPSAAPSKKNYTYTHTGGSDGKASVYNAGDPGSSPGLGRSPGEGNGNLLQYYCLENPVDRGAWWATVFGVAKSRTRLSDFTIMPSR